MNTTLRDRVSEAIKHFTELGEISTQDIASDVIRVVADDLSFTMQEVKGLGKTQPQFNIVCIEQGATPTIRTNKVYNVLKDTYNVFGAEPLQTFLHEYIIANL